jgi:uncharacterized metal-binding protein YceD (DUF177 family)
MNTAPFSFPVEAVALPASGRVYDLAADQAAREAVARELGLDAVMSLVANFTVAPGLDGSIEVSGHFKADVVQACVITLQPVPAHLEETIARRFVAHAAAPKPKDDAKAKRKTPGKEPNKKKFKSIDEIEEVDGWIDPNDEIFDPLVDGVIDLGEVVTEQLSLALDPYPKAPGATFGSVIADEAGVKVLSEPVATGPFAALAGLKVGKASPRRTERKPGAGANDRAGKGKTVR